MLLFGHLGITLGIYFGLGVFVPRLKNIIDPKYLAIGALFPDLIDKPLGRVIFASTFENGRIIGHTMLLSFILFLTGLYLYSKGRDIKVLSLASGSFFHLMEDQMWARPKTLFWPFRGLSFPKDYTDYTGIEYLFKMFKQSFEPEFSHAFILEIIGMVVIVILTFHWLIKKYDKTKSNDKKKIVK